MSSPKPPPIVQIPHIHTVDRFAPEIQEALSRQRRAFTPADDASLHRYGRLDLPALHNYPPGAFADAVTHDTLVENTDPTRDGELK